MRGLVAGWQLSRCDNSPAKQRALIGGIQQFKVSGGVIAPLLSQRDKFYLLDFKGA